MPINFSNSPSNGDTTTINGVLYTYDSSNNSWKPSSSTDFSTVTNTPTTVAGYGITDAFDGQYSSLTGVPPASPSTTIYADMTALIAATGMSNGDQALVSANNNLYIYNGSGWYKIATVQNDSPSAITGVASSYELAIDGTATTITAVSTDPEGFPLTWSYSTSGLGSIATISQADNVFTITPSTDSANAGTFTLTINATDGVNGAVNATAGLTLNFIITIENSNNTILLANAVAASNNDPQDSSSNNAISSSSIGGQAYLGAFSPYRHAGYSWDFDGGSTADATTEGEAIVAENTSSAFNVGTNDYSVECWIKARSYQTNENGRIFEFNDVPNGGSNDRIAVRQSSNTGNIEVAENGSYIITSSNSTPLDGDWHFIQLIRTGGTTTLYIDGTSRGSASSTTNIGASQRIVVGGWYEYNYGFDGQIVDFRFSNTARTAGTPTEKLTSDSNTKLLVCSKPYLVDESETATSLSLAKSTNRSYPSTKPYTPYENLAYDVSLNGGSVYFDGGSSDQIATTGNSSIWSDSGTNTIEFWFYNLRTPTYNGGSNELQDDGICLLWTYAIEIQCAARFGIETTSRDLEFRSWSNIGGGGLQTVTIESNTALNTWYHVAAVRNGQTWKFYVNGKLTTTHTQSTNYTWNSTGSGNYDGFWIGKSVGGTGFKGHLSDFWVSNTEKYTADFDVPTAPLSSTNAHLHIKGSEASVIDKTQNSTIRLRGSALGASAPVKFSNTYSMYFPGVGSWMPLAISTETRLSGTEDWTVEAWVNPTSRQSYSVVMSCGSSFALALGMVSGNFHVYNLSAGGFTDTDVNYGTYDIAANQWTHLAATRVNGNWYCYVDGTLRYQKTGGSWQSHVMNETTRYTIGALNYSSGGTNYVGNERWFGNIQDVRITKGLARYTSNFTPPTEPFEG